MSDIYYEKKLYPLQNRVLSIIDGLGTKFYLSGGTALSRFYFEHRYSDNLDFFLKKREKFEDEVNLVRGQLDKIFKTQVLLRQPKLFKMNIIDDEANLKLKFIHDGKYYFGAVKSFNNFKRVDNLGNILANKLMALRDHHDPKDLADIIHIRRRLKINWQDIFSAENSKANKIFPPIIAKIISEIDIMRLGDLKWINIFKPSAYELDSNLLIDEIIGLR